MGKHRANNSAVDVDLEGDVYADDDIFGKAICNHIRKGKAERNSTTKMKKYFNFSWGWGQ